MAGYTVVSIPSGDDGCVDIEKLKEAAGDDIAGLMLTNPNTVGLFDKNIREITPVSYTHLQKLDDHRILWCCTEMNTKEDMDLLVRIVKEV